MATESWTSPHINFTSHRLFVFFIFFYLEKSNGTLKTMRTRTLRRVLPVTSLVALGGILLFFLLGQRQTQETAIPTKETATLCSLEKREECTTGLALAIIPCEKEYYKEEFSDNLSNTHLL